MLERARKFQAGQQVANVEWRQGCCTELPFPADSFDCVLTRFSFHHFLDPLAAVNEMKRVAKPAGTILVCDVALRPGAQSAFNHWEILRDPSHTRALTQSEFESLGNTAGLALRRLETTTHERPLEELLAGSFPKPGDADRIRALFELEIQAGTDTLGVSAHRENGVIRITYPVIVLAWRKPS
jgi:SAM-dependent methyltransferase